MVICLEQDADLHMAQLMPLPLTVSCFSIIQIGFTFLVSAHLGSPEKRTVKRVCMCVLSVIYSTELSVQHLHKGGTSFLRKYPYCKKTERWSAGMVVSGEKCRLAYGLADANDTYCLLLQ